MRQINVCVIGVGNLGQHHARNYSQIPGVTLTGIVDLNEKRSEKISTQFQTKGYTDFREAIKGADAVSIVVPTTLHYSIGKEVLAAGKHCLIEKPFTTEVSHAEELIQLAQKNSVVLQIGHIERFNGAILSLQKHIKNPKFIESDRLGPYDPRVADVGVVLDLMIHDLDIIPFLAGSKVKDLEAHGTKIFSKHEDIVKVRLRFHNGCIADLSASRASFGKYRKLRIFQPDAYISVDYAAQRYRIYRKKSEDAASMKDIEISSPKAERLEPLRKELEHFIDCVREGKSPLVTGEHGKDALALALEILNKLQIHKSEI
ncbi:MAG: Gfo/Idh/MocA family oxidoreductase [Elusimicrobia bacterium]|nr:Gfo/Idh/MocA family oxidoreductase [Elusimicrobiota bacterium]